MRLSQIGARNQSTRFADAFERLVTHTDPNDPADDRWVPLVSLRVLGSVASEQLPTNTAKFLSTRLGALPGQPLTIARGLSGTATHATDYTLSPGTVNGTNAFFTVPAGQTSLMITLAALTDSLNEGSETATLRLLTNAAWEVDAAHAIATAWILEEYSQTFTTVADFNLGARTGLESVLGSGDGQLQFATNLPGQWPFIAVACSDRGTVVRINTTNGQVIGEYRTTPAGLNYTGDSGSGPQPSRTTVDLFGNVWVANRADDRLIDGVAHGSIARIGLILGQRFSKSNGVYVPDPAGRYVALSNALHNTCVDRDGDGFICTSRGLADILPWSNPGGVDSDGGVSSAEDEAMTEYTRVPCTGTRTIAVDKFNDIWVGGHRGQHVHLKVNGLTGAVVPGSVFAPTNEAGLALGGYGAVMDRLGNLWSSANDGNTLLWLSPTNLPPRRGTNWFHLAAPGIDKMYGIAADPLHPFIWQSSGSDYVFRWRTNGAPVTNAQGQSVFVGPGPLYVVALPVVILSAGAGSRYPATIEGFGMPTNFVRLEVWLRGLSHGRAEDVDVLLVSPSGAKVMLMSDAGGAFGVTNATVVFHPSWVVYWPPPEVEPIPSDTQLHYRARNYGEQEMQLPGAPAGPYEDELGNMIYTDSNPNGLWKLYIYDDRVGAGGSLQESWTLKFYYSE